MGTCGSKDGAPQVPKDPKISKSVIPQSSDKGSRVTEAKTAEVKLSLPHNYEAILKDADSPVDNSSTEKLYNQLQGGIFLNQKKKKYWVDGKSNKNCFMLFARDLSISWGEDKRYWHWPYLQEARSTGLMGSPTRTASCYLHGISQSLGLKTTEIGTGNISKKQGTVYEVVFLVMLKDSSSGWEVPVNVKLILPDGTTQQHEENLMEKPRGSWIEIPAGEFRTSFEKIGDIQFSLYGYKGGKWKRGLIIKGLGIRPKA